ncbi:Interferon-induced GTP-binding protein Mx [Trichoderma lentiforme]|uniref:Interferon-induced GTP-binding protein Mx n=1 Tax=Trichoderma lentiforme TaxID=1567552 RepID=A0A9P4X9B4_9HYPO|nr:Interferon-induced GTP-binding protein Mx [Trichoderma lentiforme]
MGDTTALGSATAEQLNNAETRRLLDTIDGLRDLSIAGIDLPQIIVVGDQCSGKSSVLEAISRVHFPVSDGICTRFPTELVLRRAPIDSTDLRIRYATDVDVANAPRMPFHESGFQRSELPDIISRAKKHMGVSDGKSTGFSKHVLRVEISGPDIPSLTLVDLPGIFHSGSSSQPQEWKPVVDKMVEDYMKQKNSIILMVVSADLSLSKHAILDMALQHDTARERTIGVITKVDLCPGSNLEDEYLRLARGQEPSHQLRLGWHVLRNRGPKEAELDFDQRDAEEEKFLKTGAWSALPLNNRGVESLRKSLGLALLKQIKSSLPELIRDIDGNLQNRQRRLAKLGKTRTTSDEMRDYLLSTSTAFHKLAEHAVEGRYNDPFFATPSDPEASSKVKLRKLRALLRNLNYVFDFTMREKGAKYKMNWDEPQPRENPLTGLTDEEMLIDALGDMPINSDSYFNLYDFPDSVVEDKGTAFTRIESLASDSQGAEFSGLPSNDFIMQLFRDQSEPWQRIAQCHIDNVVERTRLFIYQIFDYILEDDERTRDAILTECVDPFFDSMNNTLKDKLDEIMRPYTSGHGIPLEIEFRAGVWRRKLRRMKSDSADLLDKNSVAYNTTEYRMLKPGDVLNVLIQSDTSNYSHFGIDIAVDMMLTHYQMSRRTFTDNVVHLVVENCLISKLPDILSARVVTQMSDEIVKRLAEESDEVKRERSQLADEIEKLKTGLQSCQRSRPRDFSDLPEAFVEMAPKRDAPKTDAPKTDAPKTDVPKTGAPETDVLKKKIRVKLPPTSTATTTAPVFGSVSALKSPLSAFGSVAAAQGSAAKLPVFGSTTAAATTSTASPFGSTATSTSTPSAFAAATTSTPSAFGSTSATPSTASAFGSTTATTSTPSAFGSTAASTSTSSVFGSMTTTTPAQISSFFGPKPAIPSTKSSVFGSTTTALPFNSATTTASIITPSAFGSNTTPAVAAPAFGSSSTSSPFGSTATPPIHGGLFGKQYSIYDPPSTNILTYRAYLEQDPDHYPGNLIISFPNITFQGCYKSWSVEELRLVDYAQGRRPPVKDTAPFGSSGAASQPQSPEETSSGSTSPPSRVNTLIEGTPPPVPPKGHAASGSTSDLLL